MTRIVIARHGDTFAPGDKPRRIGARVDLALVASGMRQAEALGRFLARSGFRFRHVVAAPLARTMTTAAIIAAAFVPAPPVSPADWLTEIDHGPDEGADEADVIARVGADALTRWERDGTPPAGWRTDGDARLRQWRHALATAEGGGDVLFVTSNGAARFALLALPPDHRPPRLKLRTGAFGVLVHETLPGSDRTSWSTAMWDVRP